MHLQQFQERKFQEFSGDFPWDPLMFRSAKLGPPPKTFCPATVLTADQELHLQSKIISPIKNQKCEFQTQNILHITVRLCPNILTSPKQKGAAPFVFRSGLLFFPARLCFNSWFSVQKTNFASFFSYIKMQTWLCKCKIDDWRTRMKSATDTVSDVTLGIGSTMPITMWESSQCLPVHDQYMISVYKHLEYIDMLTGAFLLSESGENSVSTLICFHLAWLSVKPKTLNVLVWTLVTVFVPFSQRWCIWVFIWIHFGKRFHIDAVSPKMLSILMWIEGLNTLKHMWFQTKMH